MKNLDVEIDFAIDDNTRTLRVRQVSRAYLRIAHAAAPYKTTLVRVIFNTKLEKLRKYNYSL